MGAMSRRKGAQGEREFLAALGLELGEALSRNLQQTREGGADCIVVRGWAIEVKRRESLSVPAWWRQTLAQAEQANAAPMLAWRRNREPWAVMWAEGIDAKPRRGCVIEAAGAIRERWAALAVAVTAWDELRAASAVAEQINRANGVRDAGPQPEEDRLMRTDEIARIAHEVNRAYCQALGDDSQPAWEDAPEWQRTSAINGALFHLANPDAGPDHSHIEWMREKLADGWKVGPLKNPEKKEHPCMVPYEQLPVEQRAKDFIFRGVVRVLGRHHG